MQTPLSPATHTPQIILIEIFEIKIQQAKSVLSKQEHINTTFTKIFYNFQVIRCGRYSLKTRSLHLDTIIITSCLSSTFKPSSFASGDRTATSFPSCPFPSPPFHSPMASVSDLACELFEPTQASSPPLLPKYPHQQEISSSKSKVTAS